MEYDGCKGCRYERKGKNEEPCVHCKQNATDNYKRMTNADRIRAMTDEELTRVIMCPYDTAGKPLEIMPCVKDGNIQELISPEDCHKRMMNWLQSEVEV